MEGDDELRISQINELQKNAANEEGMVEYYEQFRVRSETKEILDSIQEKSFEDFAFGSIIGAFIGDSMGSLEEFISETVPEERL